MSRIAHAFLLVVLGLTAVPALLANDDCENCKDYPGVPRMPGYVLSGDNEHQFDSYTFTITEAGKDKQEAVEGRLYSMRYDINEGKTRASALQILRNYQNAARNAGGKTLWETGDDGDRTTTVRFPKGAMEVWIEIHALAEGGVYFLSIVEKHAMQQDVTLDASAMASDLANSGRVAVYGIYFDFAKSDLKPESKAALDEIAKLLLQQNPRLKVYIVGHTDMVGDAAANAKLSQARAQSVVSALVGQYNVAGGRLIAFGDGPYAPVASNRTEEGRAKNRRVELVEIATQ
jgi:OmpA-OmpF porin, OOP family